jgi:peptide chain release factor 1
MRRGAEWSQELLDAIEESQEARELLPSAESAEEREFFTDEAQTAEKKVEELTEKIRTELIDRDPNDDKDVILEIRAGAGGDEAALFAGELYEMYTRYADRLGFKHRTLSSNPAEVGGYKEVIVEIEGDGAYSMFKHEGGTHRVQRVPKTESQGRIHTSTATVAVLPEAEEVEVDVAQNDLEIDVYRSSGPGGQSVNTTDSAVRITHKPTGLVVTCQDEKSQLQNKEQAMRILRSRLLEREMRERQEQEGALRLAQVGSGDRSAKVRTYNFPQSRITDHRIGLTSHNLEGTLNGDLEEFTRALAAKERADRLAAEAAGTPG